MELPNNKDIKGDFGRRLFNEIKDIINECITNCLNTNINNHKNVHITIEGIGYIKKFFTKGIYSCKFATEKEKDWIYCCRHQTGYVGRKTFYINGNDVDFSKATKSNQYYIISEKGEYKFIKYDIVLTFEKDRHLPFSQQTNEYICKVDFKFVGIPEKVEAYCPLLRKNENDFVYKDMNGDVIQIYDELVWTKVSGNTLYRGNAFRFEENFIITENNDRIYVKENTNNMNVMIVNNRCSFAGMKIN